MVGVAGFELATPCTPCKCATRLRYTPTRLKLYAQKTSVQRKQRTNLKYFFAHRIGVQGEPHRLDGKVTRAIHQHAGHLGIQAITIQCSVGSGIIAGRMRKLLQTIACTTDREPLVVQQIADAADHQHLMVLVIAPIAAPLHGTQLRELLLPIAQNMGLDATQLRDLTNREVALGRDGRKRGAHGLWIQTEQPTSVLQTRTARQPSATFWSQKAHKFTRRRPSGSAP